jgi:tetratricopeptide (TPR) repeat protein
MRLQWISWQMHRLSFSYKTDADLAVADFNRAIELKTLKPDYFYERGLAYQYKDQLEKAIEDFTQAIRLNPNVGKYYWSRGMCRFFYHYVPLVPQFPKANISDRLLWEKGEYYPHRKQSFLDFERAIELTPDSSDLLYIRANYYMHVGNKEQAKQNYQKAADFRE